jgi:hypothetical protein
MLMTHYQKKWVRVIGIKNISRINYKKTTYTSVVIKIFLRILQFKENLEQYSKTSN